MILHVIASSGYRSSNAGLNVVFQIVMYCHHACKGRFHRTEDEGVNGVGVRTPPHPQQQGLL